MFFDWLLCEKGASWHFGLEYRVKSCTGPASPPPTQRFYSCLARSLLWWKRSHVVHARGSQNKTHFHGYVNKHKKKVFGNFHTNRGRFTRRRRRRRTYGGTWFFLPETKIKTRNYKKQHVFSRTAAVRFLSVSRYTTYASYTWVYARFRRTRRLTRTPARRSNLSRYFTAN